MSCGVGHRCGLALALLWLWCRLATAAPIRPLAWEPPYAGVYVYIYVYIYIYSNFQCLSVDLQAAASSPSEPAMADFSNCPTMPRVL